MPKKSKQYGWSCSECYPDSSDEEKQMVIEDFEDDNDIESRVDGFSGGKRIENM